MSRGEEKINLSEMISRIEDLLKSIPEEYRKKAIVRKIPIEEYDDCYISIEYSRPMTPEEWHHKS